MKNNNTSPDIRRDIFGNVFAAIVMVGSVISVFVAINNFINDDPNAGFIALGVAVACLVVFWLINTMIRIRLNLDDIKKNSDVIRNYCERQMMPKQQVTNAHASANGEKDT